MSFTRLVDAGVPFVFQSSRPLTPSFAAKYTHSPTRSKMAPPMLSFGPSLMSLSKRVDERVPFVRQSSVPVASRHARK
jgi:hypothetical protein